MNHQKQCFLDYQLRQIIYHRNSILPVTFLKFQIYIKIRSLIANARITTEIKHLLTINYLLLLTEVLLLLRLEIIESPRLTMPLLVVLNVRSR